MTESNTQYYPLVTIGILTYNKKLTSVGGSDTIKKAPDSLVGQDLQNLEIIIQDDCSNDCTLCILEKYSINYSYIRLSKNKKNIDLVKNIKIFLKKVDGEYFLWACVDDYYCLVWVAILSKKSSFSCHLHRFIISKDCLKSGFGSALIKHILVTLKNKFDYLTLFVYSQNAPAINFYKKFGFKDFFVVENNILMTLDLG